MGYAVGILIALALLLPTLVVVIASCYVLFAVMGGSTRALVLESVAMSAFAVFAVAGFKRDPWLVVAALAAHGAGMVACLLSVF
jgi:hypothetical protein